MKDIEKKITDCDCTDAEKELARGKINRAVATLQEAIRCQRTGQGATITAKGNTYVNCHKYHGKQLYFIIKYASSLPGIDGVIDRIWKLVGECDNVITRKDLIRISVTLEQYAKEVEDGVLVEHDKAMFSADMDFMTMRDETVDDFSTDSETLETLNNTSRAVDKIVGSVPDLDSEALETQNSTSRAAGQAYGARPKTPAAPKKKKEGHYTKEKGDVGFKDEMRRRNDEEQRKIERQRKIKNWDERIKKEMDLGIAAKIQSFCARAEEIAIEKEKERKVKEKIRELEAKRLHDLERKRARSDRRAARHPRERGREKMKIPAFEAGWSSVTFYTSMSEGSTDSDSIPELYEP